MTRFDIQETRIMVPAVTYHHLKRAIKEHVSTTKKSDIKEIREFSNKTIGTGDAAMIVTEDRGWGQVKYLCLVICLMLCAILFIFILKSLGA